MFSYNVYVSYNAYNEYATYENENEEYILFILVEKEGARERCIFYLAEINSQIFDKTTLR